MVQFAPADRYSALAYVNISERKIRLGEQSSERDFSSMPTDARSKPSGASEIYSSPLSEKLKNRS